MLSTEPPRSVEVEATSSLLSPSSCRLMFSINKLKRKLAVEKLELDELCKEKNRIRKDNFNLRSELRMLKRAITDQEKMNGLVEHTRLQKDDAVKESYCDEHQALCLQKNRLRQANFQLRHELPVMRRQDSIHKQTKEISDFVQQIEEMRNIYNDLQASIEITSCENELSEIINISLKSEVKTLLTRDRGASYNQKPQRQDKSKSMSHISVNVPNVSSPSSNSSNSNSSKGKRRSSLEM